MSGGPTQVAMLVTVAAGRKSNADRLALDEFRRCIDDKSTGAVRVSMGLVSTFGDVYRFVEFVRGFADRTAAEA